MNTVIDAGRLDQRLELLELRETEPGVWAWEAVRKAWGQVELDDKQRKNLFSAAGTGARNASLVLRRQTLTLHNALRWKNQHLFLTAIIPRGRGHLDVSAALVEVVQCVAKSRRNELGEGNRAKPVDGPSLTFPGVLTEKYLQFQPEEGYAKAVGTYVLVTPKVVLLREGSLVTVQSGPAAAIYHVRVCHVLDGFKNEYELAFSRDI